MNAYIYYNKFDLPVGPININIYNKHNNTLLGYLNLNIFSCKIFDKISLNISNYNFTYQLDNTFKYHDEFILLENNIITSKGRYINGKKNGKWYHFNINDNIKTYSSYIDDYLHGTCLTYKNDILKSTKSWNNGKQHGKFVFYEYNTSADKNIIIKYQLFNNDFLVKESNHSTN